MTKLKKNGPIETTYRPDVKEKDEIERRRKSRHKTEKCLQCKKHIRSNRMEAH